MNQAHESLKLLGRFLAEARPGGKPNRRRATNQRRQQLGVRDEGERRVAPTGRRKGERSHRQGTDALLKDLGADKWDPKLVRAALAKNKAEKAKKTSSKRRADRYRLAGVGAAGWVTTSAALAAAKRAAGRTRDRISRVFQGGGRGPEGSVDL